MWQAKAGSGSYKVMQLECKNERGKEWQLLFDFKESPHFGKSLYYETVDEAKSKAERDNFGCELKYFEFKAELIEENQVRKKEARGRFAILLSAINLRNPTDQLKERLKAGSLRLIETQVDEERFLRSFSEGEQQAIFRDLEEQGSWLDVVEVY